MDKIKILHVLHSVGGVDVSLRLIIENINPEKFNSVVVHGKHDTKKAFLDKEGKPVQEYKLPIQREINILKDVIAIYQTIKIIKKEKPDIIHAHSAKGGIIARAAGLFFKIKVFHTPQAYSYLSTDYKLKRNFFLLLERVFKNFNSVLVASSESERQRGIKEVGYKGSKALLFNNSILPIKLDNKPLKVENLDLPAEFICTVGRPSFQKNIEMMIEVINHLKQKGNDFKLVVMGVGEYSPNLNEIKKLINRFKLNKNVFLVEWIERNEIFKIIKLSKFYISTARYEGLPYSIIESLALGKACVVTDCDGNRDLIEDNKNGFVVKDGDIEKMANCITHLYYNDTLREQFEKNALKLFEEKFNMQKNILKLESLYENYSRNSALIK